MSMNDLIRRAKLQSALGIAAFALFAGCESSDLLDPPDDQPDETNISALQLPNTLFDERFANTMAGEGDATVISEYPVSLTAGEIAVFETTSTSAGGDPMLHLFDTSSSTEVAVSAKTDDGQNARLAYRPSESKSYTLAVRAANNTAAGTCDLLMNGEPWRTDVEFAGWHVLFNGLREKEQLVTVRLPNGAEASHLVYVLDAAGRRVEYRVRGGGVAGAAALFLHDALGSRTVVVGVPQGVTPGRLRLLRNDAFIADKDIDGLGDGLEAALGTCSSLNEYATGPDGNAFDCRLAADPRDTDGDGISDVFEVIGRKYTDQVLDPGIAARVIGPVFRPSQDQPLPLWGANPRHKDLFMEVDFMRRCKSENDANVVEHMSPAVARHFAMVYGDEFTDDALARSEHAMILNNPDGEPGISAHLDIGVEPQSPDDATIYGDWGGFNAVDAIVSDTKNVCDREDGKFWKGMSPNEAWKENMSPARVGIFRYTPGYPNGGGQCGNGFACAFNFHDLTNGAHEVGHTMGLGHSGPYGATGPIDPNCKPNYTSIMNYAYLGNLNVGFSDGSDESAPSLNNAALREYEGVNPRATFFMNELEQTFKYDVDRENGHVDWNRDGVIAPPGQTVRAYANFRPGGGGCEWTRYNRTRVGDAVSAQSPAMEHLGDRLYVFYSVLGAVQYVYSTSTWDCPEPGVDGCAGATFSDGEWAYMDAWGGVDVVRIGSANPELMIVSIDGDGNLWESRLRVDGGAETLDVASMIAGASPADGAPSLARMSACEVYLAYRGADGNLRTNRATCASGWTWDGEQLALSADGTPIALSAGASPAIVRAILPHRPGEAGLYGAFPAPDGRLDIWWLDPATGRWTQTDVLESRPGPIEERPAMAWVPETANGDSPGRFYLMYLRDSSSSSHMARMMMSYGRVNMSPDGDISIVEKVGLDSPFDNVWLAAWGLDLLFEPGVDTNLRYVHARRHSGGDDNFDLWLRPKADGIHDFDMKNYDDWEVLGANLCRRVVNPGGEVVHPIRCHE